MSLIVAVSNGVHRKTENNLAVAGLAFNAAFSCS
jgi:hypothetical protein